MGKELNGKTRKLLFVPTRHDEPEEVPEGLHGKAEAQSGGLSENVLHSLDI